MKGQTQAVGVVLLMALTVTAIGALSDQVFGILNSQNAEDVVPDANPGKLRMTSCWDNLTHTKFSMRNGQDQKLNTSSVSVLINGSLTSYTSSQTIVEPQDTFRLNVNQVFTDEAFIKIVSANGKEASFNCRNTGISFHDNFQTFDTGRWTLSSDASYESGNKRVRLNPGGGGSDGNLKLDEGMQADTWRTDLTFTNSNDGADEVAVGFYVSGIGGTWKPEDGYMLSFDHYDADGNEIRLERISGGSSTTLETVSRPIGAGTYEGTVIYDQGTVMAYLNGSKELTHTISSPDKTFSGFYYIGRDGSVSGKHYLEDVEVRR